MKDKRFDLDKTYKSKNINEQLLFQSVVSLKNIKDAEKFFRDLLTEQEIDEFSKRLHVARLLYEGKLGYRTIAKQAKVSTATVSRVALWLFRGTGGYKKTLESNGFKYFGDNK